VAEGDAGQGPSVPQAIRLGAKVSARVLEKPWLYRLGSKLLRAAQKSFRHGDWLATVFPPLYRWTKVRPLPAFAADFREWWKVRQSHIPNGKIQVSEPGKQVPTDNSQLPVTHQELSLNELLEQVNRLAGHGEHVNAASLDAALRRLVETEGIKKATLWATDDLTRFQIAARLSALGVTIISHDAPQDEFAQVDLGITEADYCLPDTGSLGLLASPEKRRAISLLPRVHLAIVRSSALRPDLQQVLDECKSEQYLVFVTGPSRTSDIESKPVIGAHGPEALYVWAME
jgi:L-lactate utilization protein LutC